MMSAPKDLAALGSRLERLTGEDADCCVPLYRDEAEKIARSPKFRASVVRARALSDAGRLLAVALLRRRAELCACEIQAGLGITHATVSHHMRVLTKAGVVEAERRGKWTYYRLSDREGGGLP